jgi:phosphoserine aminotransferase
MDMKNPQTFFNVGPAMIFEQVPAYTAQFFQENMGSVSHRSPEFRELHRQIIANLKKLLQIPETYGIFFSGSASELWERILLNGVAHKSAHIVNGSFSSKFHDYAQSLNLQTQKIAFEEGEGFEATQISIDNDAEMICITQNETSTGVWIPENTISEIAQKYPEKLISVDIVSSVPIANLDFNYIDNAFFSVQKAFGMPAGLGVWIVSPRMLAKSIELKAQKGIGAHHTLPMHWKNFENNETHSTPNVYGIYLLNKIVEMILNKGIEAIRTQIESRAQSFYESLNSMKHFHAFVAQPKFQSPTIIVIQADSAERIEAVKKYLKSQDISVSSGYGKNKALHIRIGNFPAVPDEAYEKLLQILKQMD